ncbi:MAG: response regulator transcription factor [Erysipelotrichaceae bacterium]|nr:response regulator transcription factor [Erysipelotrichaceae bacterium]MDY5252638.1 response regulator transcription factor [Erysipelotrichaceae bacterium]
MERILVVDDDEAIGVLIKNALEKEGMSVDVIADVEKLEIARLANYDLLLLDIMMPKIDGLSFCAKYRELIDCPIIFITAKSMQQDMVDAFAFGGDDYIKKPFSIVELRARVKAHLRREKRERKQTLILGDIIFDLKQKTLNYRNEPINLTKTEYEICELLARNYHQVFTLEDILEKILGYDSESDVTAIRVHIKNIRLKFNQHTTCPIKTI